GKDKIPIRALHAGDDFDRALTELRVSQRQIFLRDFNLSPGQVETPPTNQRLGIAERERRWILRIEDCKNAVARLPDGREVEAITTAGLWRQALKPGGRSNIRSFESRRAAEKTRRRRDNSFEVALSAEFRIVSTVRGQ